MSELKFYVLNCFLQITELAGYTLRVNEMFRVFEEVKEEKYEVVGVVDVLDKSNEKENAGTYNVNEYIGSNKTGVTHISSYFTTVQLSFTSRQSIFDSIVHKMLKHNYYSRSQSFEHLLKSATLSIIFRLGFIVGCSLISYI